MLMWKLMLQTRWSDLAEDRPQSRTGIEQAAEFLAEEGFVDARGKGFGRGHAWMPGRQRGRGMTRVEAAGVGRTD